MKSLGGSALPSYLLGRYVAVGLVIAGMVAATVWILVSDRPAALEPLPSVAAPSTSSQAPTDRPTSAPTAPAPPSSSEEREERVSRRLKRLRASDRFIGLAEFERARTYAFTGDVGYGSFAPHKDGAPIFQWRNKRQLWNSIMPKIRDQVLLAGPPVKRPLWPDMQQVLPTSVDMTWPDEVTGGRGQYASVAVIQRLDGKPVVRLWGVMIKTNSKRQGHVTATEHLVDIRQEDARSARHALNLLDRHGWAWVLEQPKRRSG